MCYEESCRSKAFHSIEFRIEANRVERKLEAASSKVEEPKRHWFQSKRERQTDAG